MMLMIIEAITAVANESILKPVISFEAIISRIALMTK